jgi:tetratricopeptide (TPR) repeat protein
MKKYEKAELLYQKSLDIRFAILGENHNFVALTYQNLAKLYYATERYGESERLYQKALAILMATVGENHPNTQKVLDSLKTLKQQRTTDNESPN